MNQWHNMAKWSQIKNICSISAHKFLSPQQTPAPDLAPPLGARQKSTVPGEHAARAEQAAGRLPGVDPR